ncbi:hypothetical protein GZH46_02674, partial [Fragariocoptes setiger]
MAARSRLVIFLCLVVASHTVLSEKVLKRVIKSTPTANSLARVKSVTITADGKTLTSSNDSNFGVRGNPVQNADVSAKIISSTTASQLLASPSSPTSTTTSAPSKDSEVSLVTQSPTPLKALTNSEKDVSTQESTSRINATITSAADQLSTSSSTSTTAWSTPTWPTDRPSKTISSSSSAAEQDTMSVASSQHHHQASLHESLYSNSGDYLRRQSSYTESSTKGGSARIKFQEQNNWFYPKQLRAQTGGLKGVARYDTKTVVIPTTTTTTPRPEPIIQQDYYYPEQIVEAAPAGMAEPFAFQFKTSDQSGNGQYRTEESDKDGTVRGSYGYTDAAGIYRHVEYVADANGFRATIKSNEPGLTEAMPASVHMTHSGTQSARAEVEPTWQSAPSGNLASFESAHKPERLQLSRF